MTVRRRPDRVAERAPGPRSPEGADVIALPPSLPSAPAAVDAHGDNPRVYDFRGALRDTAARARPGDVVVYTPSYLNHVVAYYAEDVDSRPLGTAPPEPRRGQRIFVLGSFLDKPQHREAAMQAVRRLDRGHELVAERRYPQIRIDGHSDAMRALAARCDAEFLRRHRRDGAKAGNINHALAYADASYLLVLDCDHVPAPHFLEVTLGELEDRRVAFVQTPQYNANADRGEVPAAAWSQQALFFGPIARGKDGHEAMFCCGTNVVFRRDALLDVGGFPADSVTEDFELSIRLHERGWRSRYVPEVVAAGLGPEDMASYVSQQQRWSRGCLGALGAVRRARLPLRMKVQYGLSACYFLTGWTVLVYMSFPVVRILTGAQPLAATTADQFLAHFAPYFGMALLGLTWLGGGAYTFKAFALQAASFWIHVQSTLFVLARRRGRFVVTPKEGAHGRQPRAVAPALVALAVLVGAAAYGLLRDQEPATLNNVAFAALHVSVLLAGVLPALRSAPLEVPLPSAPHERREAVTA